MDTKALKQKILDLAIRGKLVPQDPNDEPASVLLEKIRAEKQQMVNDGRLKSKDLKNDTVIFVGEDNLHYEKFCDGTVKCIQKKIPFEIPDNWAWTRFRNIIVNDKGGGTPDKSNPKYWGGSIQWMSVKDFSGAKNGVIVDTIDHVTQEGVNNSSTNIIDTSAIILCTRMGLGKYAKLAHPTAINQDLRAIWLSKNIHENYFLAFYSTLNIDGNGTTVEGIKKEQLLNTLIPIPPFKEQARIANIQKTGFSEIEIIENQKIALCELINNTKSKILDLAIRGKLVSQDPNDEPASALLERIRHEKEELIKVGKLKRDKRESVIFRGEDNSYYEKFSDGSIQCIDEAIPFIIPQGWCWCKLGTCLDVRDGTHDTPKYVTEGIPLVTSKNLNNGSIDFSNVKYISQADHDAISLRSKVDDNDILFAMIGSIGNPVHYHGEANFSIKNMALFKNIPNGMLMDYVFWWLYLSQNSMKKEAAGGLQGFVSLKYLRNFFIPVPPLPEQMRIINTIQTIITQINSIEDLIKEKN